MRRELLLVTAAVVTVVMAAGGSFQLLGIAANRARAEVLVGEVQVHAPVLVDAVFAPLNGRGQLGGAAAVKSEKSAIISELGELHAIGTDSKDVAALTGPAHALFAVIDKVLSRWAAGDRAGASLVARTQMVDAQSALTAEDGAVLAKVGAASHRATSQARDGILGLLLGTVFTVVGLLAVGDRRRRGERVAASAHFESLVQGSSDLIVVTDADGVLSYASPSLYQTLGYTGAELVLIECIHRADLPVVQAALDALRGSSDDVVHLELRVLHRDGRWLTLEATVANKSEDVNLGGFLWNARDVSERKILEAQLLRHALEDPLTGLANRVVLRDRLTNALARAARHTRPVGVLLFDLDGFKEINDTGGHGAGDSVLVEVAARMTSVLRVGDTVARLGGDEFAMVLDDLADESVVDEVASRVLMALHEPVTVANRQFRVTASVGKVMCSGDHDPEEALRHADIAMYAAKTAGKGRMVTFEPVMAEQLQERLTLARDLDGAAPSGQLTIHYQPTVDLKTGLIQGAEALVRWNHPTFGHLSPMTFIPLAEETGAIISIGRWVLNTACRQASMWQHDPAMTAVRSVAVNVSGGQLLDHDIVKDVRNALRTSGLAPGRLTLEITESVLMQDTDAVLAQLTALKALGVSLAIDDFGTGYSSLSYLRRFPVDILKIDKSFVDTVTHSGTNLTTAIVNMGNILRMKTIAEGIENDEQATVLRELGCDIGQGFLIARPVTAREFEDLAKSIQEPLLAVSKR